MAAYPSNNGIAVPVQEAVLDFNILGQKFMTVHGVKVKWIPKVKTSVALPYMPKVLLIIQVKLFERVESTVNLVIDPVQLTFYMHVLFEKDNYYSMELPTDPESMDYTLTCKDTRYKLKNFDYGPNKPKTYKVYDIDKAI
ncbi:hypothetical protein EHI2019_001066200 [Entamoeba histolytica]